MLAQTNSDNPRMSRVAWAFAGSTVDAVTIGAGGALIWWALWGGSTASVVSFGIVAGTLTALLMRLSVVLGRRRLTSGDMIISRLRH
jgi:hypothetical protein